MPGCERTAEFVATVNSKREKPQWIQQRQLANGNQSEPQKPNRLAIDQQYRDLMSKTQACCYRIRNSFEKLEKFTALARKKTVFDDGELNRLIADIRTDINESKSQLDYLQSRYEVKQKHSENIVTILQRQLANVTSSFKSTLEMRSRSVQQQSARHEMFAGPSTSSNPRLTNDGYSIKTAPVLIDMGSSGPQYSNHNQVQQFQPQQIQQQQLLMNDQVDMSERADKMQLIESTIVELSTVFNQLANMVQTQGETITRIDMNISETTGNVEAAHDALLRYFSSINSNRWLILKVFGVLFFFFVIFVMFAS